GPAGKWNLVLRQEVNDDAIIVSRIESNVPGPARLGDRAYDIEGSVSIEGRDLDRQHVGDFHEPPPEVERKNPSPRGGLKIKAHEGDLSCHGPAMLNELLIARFFEGRKGKEADMVAFFAGKTRFFQGLPREPANPRDSNRTPPRAGIASFDRLFRQAEHR